LLDLIEEPLDQITGPVEIRAEADRLRAIASWRDVGPNARNGQINKHKNINDHEWLDSNLAAAIERRDRKLRHTLRALLTIAIVRLKFRIFLGKFGQTTEEEAR
jgi:hypothetical protein